MNRQSRILSGTLVIMLFVMCGSVFSAGWYMGTEVGYVEPAFKVHYEYTYGGVPDDFTDPAYGAMAGIVGGYTLRPAERIALSIHGRISTDNAEWTLATDEPADLSYSMPWTYSFSLLPEIELFEGVSVFGEAGIGQGYIRLKKNAVLASRYTNNEWLTAYSFGVGLRFDITPCWEASLLYRHTIIEKTSFKSHLPDGTHWETIDAETSSDFYGVGLVYRFGN